MWQNSVSWSVSNKTYIYHQLWMKYLMVVYFHLQYFQQIPSYQVQNLDFASDWIQCLVLIKWLCFIRRGWIQRNVIITYTEVPILGIHPIYLGIRKWKLKSRKLTSPSPFDFKLSAKHVWIVRKHFWLILGWKMVSADQPVSDRWNAQFKNIEFLVKNWPWLSSEDNKENNSI